ncbi:MAG: gliding motility-associated C-terminal domain-containing protein [Bacteroidota bacterium]|nr:gliding motility-associated C-terminal domain-containing protein [Bacteroidota bacterium]
MKKHLLVFFFLLSLTVQAQNTVTICNGDSIFLYNNWETQNGNYTDGITSTTLIVNPTPTVTSSFILNGNAIQTIPNTYELTQAINSQSGSAWNSVTLNLTQPFNFDVDMFFGNNNGGADGIAFVLQPISTSIGTGGGGLGYEGINPSFGVEFDTWQNFNRSDPSYDHIAIQQDGDLNHAGINNLFPATGFPPANSNIEDGLWHNVIFSWDPATFNFQVVFDGTLLVNYTNNIVSNIFGNNPNVYWGFTAATGGANNLQQFRVNTLEIQLADITICNHDTIQVNPQINTSTYTYLWTPNYNITNNTVPSAFFYPDSTTLYFLEVTNSYGCSFTDSFTIFVNGSTSNTTPMTTCDSYTWPVNGNSYTVSGTYTVVSTNTSGCPHTDTLNLTINNSTSNSIALTECDSYTWPINNQTYFTSGTYTDVSINTAGCTHTETLNLTINNSTITLLVDTACGEYTWDGVMYNNSGIYTNILTSSNGCDSILTLDLTIFEVHSLTYITTCDSTQWNGVWYYNDTTVTETGFVTTNSFGGTSGCDSTATANITITNSDDIELLVDVNHVSCFSGDDGSAIVTPTGGIAPYTYLWLDGQITNPATGLSAGNYPFTVTDANGCQLDSFAIINEANEIFVDFVATSPICRYEESTLSIHISNSLSNTYTMLLLDSILKSFVIDTNGLLIPEGLPITLTPNFSGEVYIISLTDDEGCTQIFNDNVHIEVKQPPELSLNEDDICVGESSFLLNNATPTGGTYFINDVMTNYFDVENLETDDYSIRYEYIDPITSCYNEIVQIITIHESPKAGMLFSPQPTDIDDPNILFRDNSNESPLVSEWHLGDSTIIYDELSFWHTYTDTGTYTIKYYITNIYGCTDSIINHLTISPIYSVFIPNAFTPNNDGDNDYFYPSIIGSNSYNIKIFNRWGEIIYNEENGKWDGTIDDDVITDGIYSYSISVFDFNDRLFIYPGLVTLMK